MKLIQSIIAILTVAAFGIPAQAQSTAFTYQGRLSTGTNAANGLFEMQFGLYDAATNGNEVAPAVSLAPVAVSNGLFSVLLDFGSGVFNGLPRWLEITVNPFGSDQPAVTLQPRQPITATPYALHAANAANLMSLTSQPLDIKAGGVRMLRLEPGVNLIGASANIIGGSAANFVSSGVVGATIAGGGSAEYDGGPVINQVSMDFGTVGGGLKNTSSGFAATVGGGAGNTSSDNSATVAGGGANVASGQFSTVGGGIGNRSTAQGATVAGGSENLSSGIDATVGGGDRNVSGAWYSTIGGGILNQIESDSFYSTIGGGFGNYIPRGTATIGGGYSNTNAGGHATIAGGAANTIGPFAGNATIGGGVANLIDAGAENSTIAGGDFNSIAAQTEHATIAGGSRNQIAAWRGTIGGGSWNEISEIATNAVIAGGQFNEVHSGDSAILGGFRNFIGAGANWSVVAGGLENRTYSHSTTIGGGSSHWVESDAAFATIGGGGTHYIDQGAGSTTIGGGAGHRIGRRALSSTIAGGTESKIGEGSGTATIGGGSFNEIGSNAIAATISGGSFNAVGPNASYAIIPGGFDARARSYGQMVHASGLFASFGDAQSSQYVLRRTSTNTASIELFLDGFQARMNIPRDGAWAFEALVVASASDGTTASWQVKGAVKNVAGNTSLVGGSATVTLLASDLAASGWLIQTQADDANDALTLHAVGGVNTTVRWVASVRTTELLFQP